MPILVVDNDGDEGAAGGGDWCGAVGRTAARALRRRQVDQGVGQVDGAVAQHDPAALRSERAAELSARAAGERAGAVQGGDPPVVAQGSQAAGVCEPADPQAKGAVERLQGYAETNFEPERRFANELDFQEQLDGWFAKANARTHKSLKVRPVDRLAEERLAPLPEAMPDCARRWGTRVAPDPYLRVDTNDYSLEPGLVGRRVEVIVDQQHVTAVALDTGELACRHRRIFARHQTITALEHARSLSAGCDDRRDSDEVQVRPL